MRRVAAVDCGTNTLRLLVADIDLEAGTQDSLMRELRIVRLGEDVDRTGRFGDDALARVFAATEEYAAIIASLEVDAVRFVATSAARDARNAEVFAAGVQERLGVVPEVVSGDEEAQLTFDGATRTLPDVVAQPIGVVDIGGGSTEVIIGRPGAVAAARSLDIGSVRLTERLLRSDPPTTAERRAVSQVVDEALDTLPSYGVQVGDALTLVGVAGTVTTLAVLLLGVETWDPGRVHQAGLAAADVHAMVERLLALTMLQREALGVPRGRSDVIGAGALILDRVLRRARVERLLVSDADILDGIAWAAAGPPGRGLPSRLRGTRPV